MNKILDTKHISSYIINMNKLPLKTRAMILNLLCEGSSMRAIARLTGASFNTISKLLIDAGEACAANHDENVRNVKAARVQCDEIWTFTYAKQKNVETAKAAPTDAGDTWTWTALDADSKLIVSYLVGGRDAEGAVNLTKAGRSWTSELSGSSSSGHGPPRVHRVTAELAHCLASDQMTLDIEGVVDGGVGGEKPLRRS